MSQTIEVVVSPEGAVTIKTTGFAGATCRAASRALEEALGLRTAEQLTSEFHTPAGSSHESIHQS